MREHATPIDISVLSSFVSDDPLQTGTLTHTTHYLLLISCVGGAVSVNPPSAHREFPPLPPAPDEPEGGGDCKCNS